MKKTIVIVASCLIVMFFLWTTFLWKIFKSNIAGSYAHAETWSFKVREEDLIKAIKEIKKEHPELEPPNVSYPTSGKHDYWYNFTFYYNDTDENVYAWTRANEDPEYTTFAFIAIATHIDSLTSIKNINPYTKEINEDFGYFENKAQIKKFENKILHLIEEKVGEKAQ